MAAVPASLSASSTAGSTLWDQLHQAILWGRRALLGAAAFVLFVALIQGFWLYRQAADIHPLLGLGTLAAFAGGAVLVAIPAYRFLKMPAVVHPPAIPTAATLEIGHLRAEAKYLDRYLANCGRNPEFAPRIAEIDRARGQLEALRRRLGKATPGQAAEFDAELTAWVRAAVSPLLREVDQKADRIIYQESLTVGLATAASPNGTLDAFVMLWRSTRLVSQIATLYYGRPGLWGTLAVCADVSVATALAGFLQNVTDSLGGLLAKSIGGATGVVAGPAVDGVTNGLVLIRIGYLARERCRSFREWDTATRRNALASALASTQKVAVGLATEILRQVGSRVGAAAGAVVASAGRAAGSAAGQAIQTASMIAGQAADVAGSAAESVWAAANDLSQALQARLRGNRPNEDGA